MTVRKKEVRKGFGLRNCASKYRSMGGGKGREGTEKGKRQAVGVGGWGCGREQWGAAFGVSSGLFPRMAKLHMSASWHSIEETKGQGRGKEVGAKKAWKEGRLEEKSKRLCITSLALV